MACLAWMLKEFIRHLEHIEVMCFRCGTGTRTKERQNITSLRVGRISKFEAFEPLSIAPYLLNDVVKKYI